MAQEEQPLPKSSAVEQQRLIEQQKQIFKWQNKLLPWLIITPSVLILLFLFLATQQVNRFNEAINVKQNSVTETIHPTDSAALKKLEGNTDYLRWITLVKMEEESMNRRYHQGGLLLLSRIFIKYLGFLTGMIIAIVGAVFIIGKLSEDQSKIEGSAGEKIKFSIISSSPGIIFGILGTVLMVSSILQHNEITIQEQPMYLNPNTIIVTKTSASPNPVKPVRVEQLDSVDKVP
jgi:Mg2+/citrate symporter